MKSAFALLLSILLISSDSHSDPIQWTVEEGGNGHWYEYITEPESWFTARSTAENMEWGGNNGHLLTLTSAEEEEWVYQNLFNNEIVYIGGLNLGDGWFWVTGEPTEYSNFVDNTNFGFSWKVSFGEEEGSPIWFTVAGGIPANPYIVEFPASDVTFEDFITLADVPSDNGGFLSVSWSRNIYDAPSLPDSITNYHIQRFENGDWENVTSIPADQSENYEVVVPTLDIFTIGEPEPFSEYRIVASSSDPTEFFLSAVDSAYSIDNIAPPKPMASLVEGDGFRILVTEDPNITDLGEVCVYRGTNSGFDPISPIDCSSSFHFQESQFNNYFYRVQFSDIHGNLSEFSEEVGLADISGVGDFPSQFTLNQNHPNPFNPSTTISFNLPSASPVSLRIYDVSGKVVRELIAGQIMETGSQQVMWNGRDDDGQMVSAGVYFYKLSAGDFSETKRMVLVK